MAFSSSPRSTCKSWLLLTLLVVLPPAAPALPAQTTPALSTGPACPSGLSSEGTKVCQAALDGVRALHATAGLLLSGGNPVIGTAEAGGRGRFGHLQLTFRAVVAEVVAPDTRFDGSVDTVPVGHRGHLAAPQADLAFGLFSRTLPVGTVTFDLMGSVLGIPDDRFTSFQTVPGSRTVGNLSVGFGFGFRAAVIGPKLPVVSLSVMKRDTPTLQYGSTTTGDNAAYTFNTSAINVRLFAGKRFGALEIAAGGGVNLLKGDANVVYVDPATGVVGAPIEFALSSTRMVTAFNTGLVLGPVRLSGEGGYQIGKDEGLVTRFAENNLKAGKFFGSFGFGFRL